PRAASAWRRAGGAGRFGSWSCDGWEAARRTPYGRDAAGASRSGKELADRLALVGDLERPAAGRGDHGVERQPQRASDRRVEVLDCDRILGHLAALGVRAAVAAAAADAAAREQAAEGLRIVVAALVLVDVGRAAEL